jgi:hypothetical protein
VNNTPVSGTPTTTTTTAAETKDRKTYCEEHPNDKSCQSESAGTAATIGVLYTPLTKTFASVSATYQTNIGNAPINSAITSFFAVSSSATSCPTLSYAGGPWLPAFTVDAFCSAEAETMMTMAAAVVKIGALLAGIFIALF